MPVSVLALLPDPVDGVEVLVGAQAGHGVLQRVHEVAGAIPVHAGSALVLLITSCETKERLAVSFHPPWVSEEVFQTPQDPSDPPHDISDTCLLSKTYTAPTKGSVVESNPVFLRYNINVTAVQIWCVKTSTSQSHIRARTQMSGSHMSTFAKDKKKKKRSNSRTWQLNSATSYHGAAANRWQC